MKILKKIMAVGLSVAVMATMLPINASAAPKAKKIKLSAKNLTMEVGQKKTIKSKGKAGVKVGIEPAKASKAIEVRTSDDDVVALRKNNAFSYTATAVGKGNAKLTVISKSNKKLKMKIKVKVDDKQSQQEIFSMRAGQSAENKITAYFTSEVPDLISLSNFTLRDKTGNSIVALKDMKTAKDKRSVILEAHINFNDGSGYELSYSHPSDGKTYTADISVAKGDVADLKLVTESVALNVPKELEFAVIDDRGVDVTNTYKSFVNVSVDMTNGAGVYEAASRRLTMYRDTEPVKVIITYINGTKKVEKTAELKVTKETTETVSIVDWLFVQSGEAVDWTKLTKHDSISIATDTTDMKFYVRLKTSDGKTVTSDTDASVIIKSTNESSLRITGASMVPAGKGLSNIIVEYTYQGKTSKFTPVKVNVGDNAKPVALVLSAPYTSVKPSGVDRTAYVARINDQYGNAYKKAGTWTFKYLGSQSVAPVLSVTTTDKINVEGNGAAMGYYEYRGEYDSEGIKIYVNFGVTVTP